MRRRTVMLVIAVVGGALLVASLGMANGGKKNLRAGDLNGYEENPDISTVATGSFKVTIDDQRTDARLRAQLLRARGNRHPVAHPLRQAGRQRRRIRLPVRNRSGTGPAGTPTCPPDGTVSRTVDGGRHHRTDGTGNRAGELRGARGGAPRRARRTRTSTRRSGRAGRSAPRSTTADQRPLKHSGARRAQLAAGRGLGSGRALSSLAATPCARCGRSRRGRTRQRARRRRRGGRT